MPIVENLTVPGGDIEERRVRALEDQARALEKTANAWASMASNMTAVSSPMRERKPAERFEYILGCCLQGRACATNPPSVEGFLTFARELCDGIDREFPPAA